MLPEIAIEDGAGRLDRRVLVLLRAALGSLNDARRTPVRAATDQFERVARSFGRHVVGDAIAGPRPIASGDDLVHALSQDKPSAALGGTAAALAAIELLERIGPLKFIAKRTPWLTAASGLAAAYASFARGADELSVVSSYLVTRSRMAGQDPDPERVRRVAVQLLQEQTVDPVVEPRHGDLVMTWARRAVRNLLPFAGHARARRARALAAAAAAVDPDTLVISR